MDGVHNANTNLWELDGKFIQVGNNAGDFVNVTMSDAAGGKGFFFREDGKEGTVLAMKNSILPVVAVPDAGNTFSVWEKVSGDGSFEGENLADTYYIPKTVSELKPVFRGVAPKPTLGIVGTYEYNGSEQTANVSGYDPATMNISGNKETNAGTYTISVTPKGGAWYDGTTEAVTVNWTIEKGNINANDYEKSMRQGVADEQTVNASHFGISVPGNFALNGAVTDASGALDGTPTYGTDIKFKLKASATAGNTVTIPVTFTPTDTNYNAKNITLTVNITSKDVPVVTVNPITVTYDGNPVPASKITGSATFGADSVAGSFSWKGTPAITNVADSGSKTVTFKSLFHRHLRLKG